MEDRHLRAFNVSYPGHSVKARRRVKKFFSGYRFLFSGDRWGRLRGLGCFFLLAFGVDNLRVGIVARQAAFFGGEFEGFFAVELGLADEFFDAVGEALRGIGVGARISGGFGADQERNFAARGAFLEGSGEFGEFAAPELFVHLGHFARDARAAIAKHFARVGNTLRDTMRRLIKNDGAVLDAQAFEGATPFATARRQKPNEEELFVGQARGGEGSEQCGWTRNWHDRNVVPQAECNEAVAGIGNERHARVADQRDFRALLERHDQFRGASHLIVFVVADERLVNVVVREKLLRVARVFAGDFSAFLVDVQAAPGGVFEMAEGLANTVR